MTSGKAYASLLGRLNIGHQILLGFSVVLFILLVVSVNGYRAFTGARANIEEVVQRTAVADLARQLDRDVVELLRLANRYGDHGDNRDGNAAKDAVEAIKKRLASARASITNPDWANRLTVMTEQIDAFSADLDRLIETEIEQQALIRDVLDPGETRFFATVTRISNLAARSGEADVVAAAGELLEHGLLARAYASQTLGRHDANIKPRADREFDTLTRILEALTAKAAKNGLQIALRDAKAAVPPYAQAFDRVSSLMFYQDDLLGGAMAEEGNRLAGEAAALAAAASGDARTIQEATIRSVGTTSRLVLALTAVGIGLSVALALILGAAISRPVVRMTKAMKALAAGDMTILVPDAGRQDEIGKMAQALEVFKANAEALHASEAKYRRIVDTANEGIWMVDPKGTILFANSQMALMLGYSVEELIGLGTTHLHFQEDLADHEQRMRNRRAGMAEHYERRYRRKDGTTLWGLISSVPVFDNEHRFQGSFGTTTDITQLKQAEETLRRTNRELWAISSCNQTLLRATVEQALLDQICHIVSEKAGYCMAWVGYAQDDAQKTIRPVAWSGVEQGYLGAIQATWSNSEHGHRPAGAAIRTGQTVCVQDLAKDPQAAPWRELSLQRGYQSTIALPLKDEQARTTGVFVIYSAVPNAFTPDEVRLLEELAGDMAYGIATLRTRTERARAEEAMRQSEERLRLTLQAARIGTFDWDLTTDAWYASPTYYTALGYEPRPDSAERSEWVERLHPEDRARVTQLLLNVRDRRIRGEQYAYEARMRHADGSYRWVNAIAFGIEHDSEGNVTRILGLRMDITERKQAEEALRQAKEAADEANRSKDQFLAVLSHELRTPLTPVLATVTALEVQDELPAEIREDLQLIRRNVALETKLIDDLLDFTRLARGKIQLHHEVVDAHACLEAALQVCQGQIQEKRLNVLMHLEAQQHQVWADPARLQQVFWNLLQNAAKFTPEQGTIHLGSCNQDGHLQLQVQDSGIGIEPAMLARIFDAFVQAEQTKARRFGGLGMGLTIAKNIMDLHQGRLTASSAGPNQGATFTVELALFAAPPTIAEPPPPAAAPKPRQGRRILLVEDTPDTLKILTKLLTRWGHQVTPADSVHAALECAARERFDLLVSDIGLPDGSGLDIMRQVKQAYDLPGIAVSGYGMEEDIKQSMEAGFARHLTKPLSFEALQAAVCEVVLG